MAQSVRTNNKKDDRAIAMPAVISQVIERFQRLGLKAKATVLAIAIGTIPVVAIGVLSYVVVSRTVTDQVLETNKSRAFQISDKLNRFMFERYGDIQVLASLDLFTDPNLKVSTEQKSAALDRFIQAYGAYNSISVIGLDGNTEFSDSKTVTPAGFNYKQQQIDYFEQALVTNIASIGYPRFSKITKKFSLFASAPIKINGQTTAVIRSRIPIEKIDDVLKDFSDAACLFYIADAKTGKIFASNDNTEETLIYKDRFPSLGKVFPSQEPNVQIISEGGGRVLTYVNTATFPGLPNLNWTVILSTPTKVAFAAQQGLLIAIAIGTVVTTILVTFLAIWIANRATKPIEEASEALDKIGKGNLDTRVSVLGSDEIALLNSNINLMAELLEERIYEQDLELERINIARQEARADADANAQEQKLGKEKLQYRALELLMEVDPISRGDLTIRAQVTDDEIGTIADSYNSTVQNLRRIVVQVQAAAQQVTDTTTASGTSVEGLSTEALRQAEEISDALDQVQTMSKSIRSVTASAEQAEVVVQQAAITLQEGDAAMNLTVDGILAIRDTVAEASEKVKRLGETSQSISRVVNLINSFAEQTNLLALNAAIEAARAGAQGRGFAVVADEVQALAQQSADATAEISELVAQIQAGTNEVILAMESGTKQVNTGTQLVGDARKNLTQIAEASAQISNLVAAIAAAATEQSKASDTVTETITDVAAIALNTSTEANQVSNSFKDLLEVAQQLQKSVGQFKV